MATLLMSGVDVVRYPMAPTRVDEHLQMLANVHRRRVLEYLRRGRRRHATVDELAEHLRTHQEMGEERRIRGVDRLRVVLKQLYLPQLDAEGIVDWDRRRDEVRYREVEVVEAVLDALAEDSVPVEN